MSNVQKYLTESQKRNIAKQREVYEAKLQEYRAYDEPLLYKLLEQAQKKSEKSSGAGAEQYFAALEVLRERSKEERQNKIFSKNQAELIVLFTGIIAFVTLANFLMKLGQ